MNTLIFSLHFDLIEVQKIKNNRDANCHAHTNNTLNIVNYS